jgi:hypothetical protein
VSAPTRLLFGGDDFYIPLEPLYPPVDRDLVDLDAAFDQELFDVTVGQAERRYQRTASTITSGGKRSRRRRIERLAWGEGGGFSCQQSRRLDAVAANATARRRRGRW